MKRIGITLIILVIMAIIGVTYANNILQPESQQITDQSIQNGATKITFDNNGNSWVHTVVVFESIPKKDGTTGNIYADTWLKPKENGIPGTATIDLSNLAGYGNNPLPTGTKIQMNIWGNILESTSGGLDTLKLNIDSNAANIDSSSTIEKPNIYVIKLPTSVTDNKIKISEDPAKGGEFLSDLISNENSVITKQGITWNDEKSFTVDGSGIAHAANVNEAVLCFSAAGGEENSITNAAGGENSITNAAEETIPMQETGLPIIAGLLASVMIIGGLMYKRLM